MPEAIGIENLSFRYPHSQRTIFSNLNWTVGLGDFWVIVGSNGSGKTSLVRLISGLECANKGSIRVLGKPLQSLASAERAGLQIGYVPQNLQFDQRFPIPVLEVVEGGTLPHSFWRGLRSGKSARQRADTCSKALAQVGMDSCAQELFSQLSGGQKQRVLIARALATESPILILDEPTASVDPAAAQRIMQICQQLHKKHTILFISHDISMIPDVCEHILCLNSYAEKELEECRGSVAHSHDVRGLSRKEILLLLYSHWGLNQSSES